MLEQMHQVAIRLRALREAADYSLEELAEILSITPEQLALYESGEADIPASLLFTVANHFRITLAALLTGEDPKLRVYCLTRAGEGISVNRRKEYKYQNLAANFVSKKAEPFLVRVDPAPEDAPFSLNSHPGQEYDYVLSGRLALSVNGTEMVLEPGDSIYYDSTAFHGMKALGDEPCQFLAIIL